MKVIVVGTGYVGLVTGACLAEMGNNVICVDINEKKIEGLKNGIVPIYEPGLEEIVKRNFHNNRLGFSTKLSEVIADADIVFSAVGTPPKEDGSADLKYVLDVAREFGRLIRKRTVFVTKSTVPVGTAKKVAKAIIYELNERAQGNDWPAEFDVVSNPEFLKEGTAVKDFFKPERIVVGTNSDYAKNIMEKLYSPFVVDNPDRLIFTDIPSAEMIKYASNSMLATRISFMNEIANLCDKVGANIESVRKGMGSDSRIGSKFLYAGCGYGGSCFPKDVKALAKTGRENSCVMKVIEAVDDANENQKHLLFYKIRHLLGNNLDGKTIAIWGLSFKPDTDDMRESPSLVLLNQLIAEYDCYIKVYDPIVNSTSPYLQKLQDKIHFCGNMYEAAENADVIVLVTEWKEFRTPDWNIICSNLQNKNIVDGRNIYDRAELESLGFNYIGFGK